MEVLHASVLFEKRRDSGTGAVHYPGFFVHLQHFTSKLKVNGILPYAFLNHSKTKLALPTGITLLPGINPKFASDECKTLQMRKLLNASHKFPVSNKSQQSISILQHSK